MIKRVAFALALMMLAIGCDKPQPQETSSSGKPVVYVTFYPLQYFAQRIAGATVNVRCGLPVDADPSFWMPDAAAIQAYQQADLIIINGAHFEHWVDVASLPPGKMVETAAPFQGQWIKFEHAVTHSHGPGGPHTHEGIDGHTWLDPVQAQQQAAAIFAAIKKLAPANESQYTANFASLNADLDQLNRELIAVSRKLADRTLLASHPAYNYLARRYGWKVKNITLSPQAPPDEPSLAIAKAAIDDRSAKIILWESQPAAGVAEKFKTQLGLESVLFSPCETLDASDAKAGDDYVSLMRRNIERLRSAL